MEHAAQLYGGNETSQNIYCPTLEIEMKRSTPQTFALDMNSRTTGAEDCSSVSSNNVKGLAPSRRFNNFWKRRRLWVLLCEIAEGAMSAKMDWQTFVLEKANGFGAKLFYLNYH